MQWRLRHHQCVAPAPPDRFRAVQPRGLVRAPGGPIELNAKVMTGTPEPANIEPTAPGRDAHLRYAGFVPRVCAFAIDFFLIAGYAGLLATVSSAILFRLPREQVERVFAQPMRADLVAFVTLVLPVIVVFALAESSGRQASWGKRWLRLRVVTTAGGRPSRSRALARNALKFLPWQVSHTCLFHIPGWPLAVETVPAWTIAGFTLVWGIVAVYGLSLLVPPTHRTPYDRAAGTCVVFFR